MHGHFMNVERMTAECSKCGDFEFPKKGSRNASN